MKKILLFFLISTFAVLSSCNEDKPTENGGTEYGTLEGKIYQVNTNVSLSGVSVEAGGKSSTSTGDGLFKIENIQAGEITVRAIKTDYEIYEQTVTITANQTTEHDIYMTGSILTTNISGNVWDKDTNEPISGVKITIANQVDYTDASGHYQLPNLPQGTHDITAVKENYKLFEGRVFLSSSDKVFNIVLEKTIRPCPGTPTVTYSGKTYNTVQIGDQCWLKENLDVGTMIESNSGSDNQTDNGTIEKYCHNNNASNCKTYGGLYQWNEAMQYVTTEGSQGICPDGWHIPTIAEFEALRTYMNDQAAALIDESEELNFTPTVTQNETGFSALLAGYRSFGTGAFYELGRSANFWSSTENSSNGANFMILSSSNSGVNFYDGNDSEGDDFGFSVRCLKD